MKINMLKFIGSGSAFNTKLGNNSAYLKFNEAKEMLLIDCGTTTLQRIKDNNILKGVEHIHVAITHTHDYHIGSLASLILYTYYSHGEFAKSKVTVYSCKGVKVDNYLKLTGCIKDKHYKGEKLNEGFKHYINNRELIFSFDKTKHVKELTCYNLEIEFDDEYYFYSGDSNVLSDNMLELIEMNFFDYLYIDTCKADYPGNIHLSLRELSEKVKVEYRHNIYCMHLDEGFDKDEAESLGFKVVENEFSLHEYNEED